MGVRTGRAPPGWHHRARLARPKRGLLPSRIGGQAFIAGAESVSVRGPGAWILSCAEGGVQSSSRRWHPITGTTASEMQLLPGSMWRRGDRADGPLGCGDLPAGTAAGNVCPGRRGAGGWGSRWSGQRGASGAASAAAVRNGVSSRSFLGRKCVTSPFAPRDEVLRVPGSGEGSRPATVLREVLLSCTQGLFSHCWELLFQDLLPSLCRHHARGPAPTGQGSAPG